jgi:hypothetical protein
MGTPKLNTPTIHVVMEDGSEFDVQARNVDLVAWDRTRAKHGWPQPADAPFVWMNYLAWHALTKTQGILPAMTLSEFEKAAAEVTSQAEDDTAADPTNPEPAPE